MSDTTPRPVAVLGCGHLGTYHARLYHSLPEAELVGVVDPDESQAAKLAAELSVPAFSDWRELPDQVEAVSVATPTTTHEEIGVACLERGWHLLVEKPITDSVEAGQRLVSLAAKKGKVLAVGHVERFSPAFLAARPSLDQPRFVESHRLAPFVPRSLDVDVVLDLMIHDLDLTLSLVEAEVESVDAVGVPVLTDGADIANARIRFTNGAVANLTASRVSRDRTRKIRFFGPQKYHSLDLMEGRVERVLIEQMKKADQESPYAGFSLEGFASIAAASKATQSSSAGESRPSASNPASGKKTRPEMMDAAAALPESLTAEQGLALLAHMAQRGLQVQYGDVPVSSGNALEKELADFLAAIDGNTLVGASGEAGLRSLVVAEEVRNKVQESLGRLGIDPAK